MHCAMAATIVCGGEGRGSGETRQARQAAIERERDRRGGDREQVSACNAFILLLRFLSSFSHAVSARLYVCFAVSIRASLNPERIPEPHERNTRCQRCKHSGRRSAAAAQQQLQQQANARQEKGGRSGKWTRERAPPHTTHTRRWPWHPRAPFRREILFHAIISAPLLPLIPPAKERKPLAQPAWHTQTHNTSELLSAPSCPPHQVHAREINPDSRQTGQRGSDGE